MRSSAGYFRTLGIVAVGVLFSLMLAGQAFSGENDAQGALVKGGKKGSKAAAASDQEKGKSTGQGGLLVKPKKGGDAGTSKQDTTPASKHLTGAKGKQKKTTSQETTNETDAAKKKKGGMLVQPK